MFKRVNTKINYNEFARLNTMDNRSTKIKIKERTEMSLNRKVAIVTGASRGIAGHRGALDGKWPSN